VYADFVIFVHVEPDSLYLEFFFTVTLHCANRRLADAAFLPIDQDAAKFHAVIVRFQHEDKIAAEFTAGVFDTQVTDPGVVEVIPVRIDSGLDDVFTGMGLAIHLIEDFELVSS
jgi:hypothetical protein